MNLSGVDGNLGNQGIPPENNNDNKKTKSKEEDLSLFLNKVDTNNDKVISTDEQKQYINTALQNIPLSKKIEDYKNNLLKELQNEDISKNFAAAGEKVRNVLNAIVNIVKAEARDEIIEQEIKKSLEDNN